MEPNRDGPGPSDARHRPRRPRLAFLLISALAAGLPLAAQPGPTQAPAGSRAAAEGATATAGDPMAGLRAEIAALKAGYEARIAGLEARLAALEATQGSGVAPPAQPGATGQAGEQADLRAAARAAAAQLVAEQAPTTVGTEATAGRGRSLNRLNPEISFTGDLIAVAQSRDRDQFDAREFELDFQSALDPFSRTRWTLAFGSDGEVDVEEGYATYNALPGGISLNLGKFRQQFGSLNRQHRHALPQSDYPLVLRTFFGDEALAQTGLSARWLLPHPWATANELTLEATDGENEAFGGETFHDFAGLAHLKNYWDLSPAAYFEWGLTGTAGKTAEGRGRRIWGTDFTLQWRPPQRAKYRELTWRTELLLSELDGDGGGGGARTRAWGGYTYAEGLLAQNLYAGARVDRVEDPFEPSRRRWGIVPYVTWWQSEFVRLRGEYRHVVDEAEDRSDDALVLQLTWAAGPHKHETY